MEAWELVKGILALAPEAVSAVRALLPAGAMLDELDSVRRARSRYEELAAAGAAGRFDDSHPEPSDFDVLLGVHAMLEAQTAMLGALLERRAMERRCADAPGGRAAPTPPPPLRRAPRLSKGPGGPRSDK